MDLTTVKGAILGLITGDALGVPVEFQSRAELRADPVTGMRGYGVHGQPAGTWSDDSSMALCLLESLCGGLDCEDMMTRFLRWGKEGALTPYGEVFDMGRATCQALTRFARGTPALACGGTQEQDNGNGSLMRILPLALYLHSTLGPDFPVRPEALSAVCQASALTHAHPVSLIACWLYCCCANVLLCGETAPEVLQKGLVQAKALCRTQPELSLWLDLFHRVDIALLSALPEEAVSSSGYVLHTLEAALWCLLHTQNLPACLLTAVNLGEDTDTTGAVAGGLAGIRWGLGGIPAEWLAALARREDIEALCTRFTESLERNAPGAV